MGDPDKPGNRISAFMRIDKLILNNQIYTTDSVQNIPASIKSRVEHPPATIKSGSVTIFFTKESKLSNFYPCQFEIEGLRFSSVEKYLCYKKALLFDSRDVASDLLTINEPKDLKRRVKRLPNFDADRWATEAGSILMNALLAKFSQNTDLRDELLATGDSLIGEACSHDLLFGIGLSLFNPNAMDSSRWRGENLQGQTLMKVRDQLPAENNDQLTTLNND